ncbi:SRPBCC domain-containing protein [Devosia sp. CN2-171]|uniref:SRPBCC domain-containing protein n=1 Tax=Devosia sp. CN2-171 TaxID=3400909 RepID=UPI003BF794C0
MDGQVSEAGKYETTTERASGRELVVTRTFDGPARHVFKAWTTPDLLQRWWAPKSIGITLVSCEVDARTGGTYRFEFGVPGSDQPVAFFGRYIEVVPDKKIVWTNEEGEDGSVTTATFEEKDGRTLLVISDLYPTEAALDAAIASGSVAGYDEQFGQLDELLPTLRP